MTAIDPEDMVPDKWTPVSCGKPLPGVCDDGSPVTYGCELSHGHAGECAAPTVAGLLNKANAPAAPAAPGTPSRSLGRPPAYWAQAAASELEPHFRKHSAGVTPAEHARSEVDYCAQCAAYALLANIDPYDEATAAPAASPATTKLLTALSHISEGDVRPGHADYITKARMAEIAREAIAAYESATSTAKPGGEGEGR